MVRLTPLVSPPVWTYVGNCRGADSRARRNAADYEQAADKTAGTDCVCSGAHCAAVGGFAALRMRRAPLRVVSAFVAEVLGR